MGLLELKSKLAVGAGQPMGSPTGNNMGSSVAPQEVDYFPNIHATGFTMNFGGPPSLFTLSSETASGDFPLPPLPPPRRAKRPSSG